MPTVRRCPPGRVPGPIRDTSHLKTLFLLCRLVSMCRHGPILLGYPDASSGQHDAAQHVAATSQRAWYHIC